MRVIVLHHTASDNEIGDFNTLWGKAEVSIHYLIGKTGTIYYGVRLGKAAWHAGRSRWNGLSGVNGYSIGIELTNRGDGHDPYPPAQLAALDYLIAAIIRPQFGELPITRHRDISLEGKIDPSNNFPWHDYQLGTRQVTERLTVTGADIKEDDVSITKPDAERIGKRKWRIAHYDHQTAGLTSYVHISYPAGPDAGVPWESSETVTAIFYTFNDFGGFAPAGERKVRPGQTATWTAPGYAGPVEIDLTSERPSVTVSTQFQP